MNIRPVSNRPREISVTEPVLLAWERMKVLLFRPFDLGKWFVIGFCAWLAGLGGSFGSGGAMNSVDDHHESLVNQLHHAIDVIWTFTLANLAWMIPAAVFVLALVIGVALLVRWLNCRGEFMFVHCIATNRAEVETPWHQHARAANRLFWFRLVLGLAGLIVIGPIAALMVMVGLGLAGDDGLAMVFALIGLAAALFLAGMVFLLIQTIVADFAVPILYLRGGSCRAACREVFGLMGAHPGSFVLYFLMKIVLSFVMGFFVLLILLATCCMACCLAVIPYIGTVLVLPVLVFQRGYSLYFLAQFGPAYDVFAPAPPLAPPAGPQPAP